jgi:hypothetical protein
MRRAAIASVLLSLLVACGQGDPAGAPKDAKPGTPAPSAPAPSPEPGEAAKADEPTVAKISTSELKTRLKRYAPAEITADTTDLSDSERQVLDKLISASRLLDPVFDRQAWAGNPELDKRLKNARDEDGRLRYAYFRIMRGPWDRQAHFEPFAIDRPHPPGAGFYPEDLTAEAFRAWVEAHPADEAALQSLYTVIERDGDALVAKPYHEAYGAWLEPAATMLKDAADLSENASLAKFLRLRADALRTDDYYESDKAWMDLDSRVEVTIGPYETYEDELMGLKASYEAFVTVSDPAASEALAKFKKYLPAMEKHLPVPAEVHSVRGAESPIRVVDLVFTAGDARKSVQTIAFNLPNDERVRKEKGAKKVLLRNLIRTKFDLIMKPIGERLLAPELHQHLSGDAFFQQVLFHELSHSLGPGLLQRDGKEVEVRVLLGPSYSALEECKADVMGVWNILFMIEKGELPEALRDPVLASYFAGLFRSVRFGVAEAHGQGAAIQIARYVKDGVATWDPAAKRFSLDLGAFPKSIETLVHDLVMLQHAGDEAAATAFVAEHGGLTPEMEGALAGLADIPVDVRPVYPLAGETK